MGIPVWRLSDLNKSKDQTDAKERLRRSPIRRADRRRAQNAAASQQFRASQTGLVRSRSLRQAHTEVTDVQRSFDEIAARRSAIEGRYDPSANELRDTELRLRLAQRQLLDLREAETRRRAAQNHAIGASATSAQGHNESAGADWALHRLQNELGTRTDSVATPSTFLRNYRDFVFSAAADAPGSANQNNQAADRSAITVSSTEQRASQGRRIAPYARYLELRHQVRQREELERLSPTQSGNNQMQPRVVDQLHEIVIDQPLRIPREALAPRRMTTEEEDRILEEYEERHRIAAIARFGPDLDVDTEDATPPPASQTIWAPPAYPEYQEESSGNFTDHVDEELSRAGQIVESASRAIDRGNALLSSTSARPPIQASQRPRLPGVESILAQPYVQRHLHDSTDVPVPPMAFPPRLLRETTARVGRSRFEEEPLFTDAGINDERLETIQNAIFRKSAEDSLCDAVCYVRDFFPHWSHYTDVWRLWDLCHFLDHASPAEDDHNSIDTTSNRTINNLLLELHSEATDAIWSLFHGFCRQTELLRLRQHGEPTDWMLPRGLDNNLSPFQPEVHPNTGMYITEDARDQSRALGHTGDDHFMFQRARVEIDDIFEKCREHRALLSEVLSLPQARMFRDRLGGRQVSPEDELLG